MKKTFLSLVAVSMLIGGAAMAQTSSTTTTTTWTNDQGTAIREYSTTQKYNSYNDPALRPQVGVVVPDKVTVYPLASTVTVTQPDTYSYSIINNNPVVVERTTRKVVKTWDCSTDDRL